MRTMTIGGVLDWNMQGTRVQQPCIWASSWGFRLSLLTGLNDTASYTCTSSSASSSSPPPSS
eukprot:2190521-Karenia_brevis.AAC.1